MSGDIFEASPNKIWISSPRPKTTSESANTNYVTHDDVALFSLCYTCCLNLFVLDLKLLQQPVGGLLPLVGVFIFGHLASMFFNSAAPLSFKSNNTWCCEWPERLQLLFASRFSSLSRFIILALVSWICVEVFIFSMASIWFILCTLSNHASSSLM